MTIDFLNEVSANGFGHFQGVSVCISVGVYGPVGDPQHCQKSRWARRRGTMWDRYQMIPATWWVNTLLFDPP